MIAGLAAHSSRSIFTVSTCGVTRAKEGRQGSGAAGQEPTPKALQEDAHLSLKAAQTR